MSNVFEAIALLEHAQSISSKDASVRSIHASPLPHKNPLHAATAKVAAGSTTASTNLPPRSRRSNAELAVVPQPLGQSCHPTLKQEKQQSGSRAAAPFVAGHLVAKASGAAPQHGNGTVAKQPLKQLCGEVQTLAARPPLAPVSTDSRRPGLMHMLLRSLLDESASIGQPDSLSLADVCAAVRVRCQC